MAVEDPGAAATGKRQYRIEAIDRLRGLVLILMVLDHVREYFSAAALQFEPTDLTRTTALLFATRWVTHLCAPTFVFLAGVSVHLMSRRRSGLDTAAIVAGRGLWLIALEFSLISFAFSFAWPFFLVQVIWAIGASLVLSAALLKVNRSALLLAGIALVIAIPMVTATLPLDLRPNDAMWKLLFQPGALGTTGMVAYPLLPWFAIFLIGLGLAPMFEAEEAVRRKRARRLGLAMLALFVVLRLSLSVGDPAPFVPRDSLTRDIEALLNVAKYPPSPMFVLVMLGCSLCLYAALERLRGRLSGILVAFGRAPFFTYVLHIFLVHGSAMIAGILLGFPASAFTNFIADTSALKAAHWGVGLPGVYAIWVATVCLLYPCARWFAGVKQRHASPWLTFL